MSNENNLLVEVAALKAQVAEQDALIGAVREYVVRWIGNEVSEQTVLSALCVLFSEDSDDE